MRLGRGPEECIPGALSALMSFAADLNRYNGHLFATWAGLSPSEVRYPVASINRCGQKLSASKTVNPDSELDHYSGAAAAHRAI